MFSCKHCSYVQAYEDRLVTRLSEDDRPCQAKGFNFPYLRDASQHVADAYGVAHTPELCVFDRTCRLAYTAEVDDNWQNPHAVSRPFLRGTLDGLLWGEASAVATTPAVGCTIKWAH
jgi:hypothetical protein